MDGSSKDEDRTRDGLALKVMVRALKLIEKQSVRL